MISGLGFFSSGLGSQWQSRVKLKNRNGGMHRLYVYDYEIKVCMFTSCINNIVHSECFYYATYSVCSLCFTVEIAHLKLCTFCGLFWSKFHITYHGDLQCI